MAGIGIVELILLILLALAAFAIAKHKPAAILWIGGLLLLAVVGAFGVAFLSYQHVSRTTDWSSSTTEPVPIQFQTPTGSVSTTLGEHGSTTSSFHFSPWLLSSTIVLAALVVGGLMLVSRLLRSQPDTRRSADGHEPWHDDRRRGGWGWLLAPIAIVAVLVLYWMRVAVPVAVVQRQQEQLTDNVRRQLDVARQRAQDVQQQSKRNINELMNEFDKPRIPLNGPTANKKMSYEEAKGLIEGEQPAVRDEPVKPPATEEHGEAASTRLSSPKSAAGSASTTSENPAQISSVTTSVDGETIASATMSAGGAAAGQTMPAAETPQPPGPTPSSQPAILKIQFDQARLKRHGVSFGQVAAAFLTHRRDYVSPVRIDGEKLLIEIESASELSAKFSEMLMTARSGQAIHLSELTDTITTTGSPSVKTSSSGPRPRWVDDPPQRAGDVWRQVVVVGDYSTVEECYRHADEELFIATWNHLAKLLGHSPAAVAPERRIEGLESYQSTYQSELAAMGIGIDFIRREIVPAPRGDQYAEYLETVQTRTVGPMQRLYTLLEFTPEVDAQLRARWINRVQSGRIAAVGTTGGIALAVVGLIYGLLKADTWTKGYYTKRLFLGVPALIVALVFLMLLARI